MGLMELVKILEILELVLHLIAPVAALVGAVAALVGVASVIFVVRQLWFITWTKAQEIFTNKEFTAARKRVYERIPLVEDAKIAWNSEDYLVCRKMDELASLAPYLGMFGRGEKLVLNTWLDPLAKSWVVLRPLIVEEQKKTQGWPKWKAFDDLGEKAKDRLDKIIRKEKKRGNNA